MSGAGVNAQCGSAAMQVTPDGNVSISCGSGTTTSATFTLSAPASLAPNYSTVNEVTVNRSGSSVDAITVPYSLTGCTSSASSVTFNAGISTPQSIALVTPASGTCGIMLGTPSSPGVLGSPNSATISIVNPNADVSFTFTAASTATQIAAAASTLTVQRSGGTAGTWNVPYTVGGTTSVATVGGTGTLSFPAGSSTATIPVTPAAAPPAGVTLPASLTVALGAAVQAAGGPAGQNATLGAIPTHTVTVNAASDCPAPPTNLLNSTFAGAGNVIVQVAGSGQIVSIPLPLPPWGGYTGSLIITNSPSAGTPEPVTLELSVNKCKGKIDTNTLGTWCNYKTNSNVYNSITWQGVTISGYSSDAAAYPKGWCYAPYADGPYYLNARWTYSSCPGGASACGFAIQFN
ncbi:MAG: hypothetical protein ACXWAC_05700 [Usitatibacter sp.]